MGRIRSGASAVLPKRRRAALCFCWAGPLRRLGNPWDAEVSGNRPKTGRCRNPACWYAGCDEGHDRSRSRALSRRQGRGGANRPERPRDRRRGARGVARRRRDPRGSDLGQGRPSPSTAAMGERRPSRSSGRWQPRRPPHTVPTGSERGRLPRRARTGRTASASTSSPGDAARLRAPILASRRRRDRPAP